MDHKQVGWIFIGVLFCMSFTADIAQAKCSGKWAIHHCMGGNKRSESADFNQVIHRNAIVSKFLEKLLSKKIIPASLLRELKERRKEQLLASEFPSEDRQVSGTGLSYLINRLQKDD